MKDYFSFEIHDGFYEEAPNNLRYYHIKKISNRFMKKELHDKKYSSLHPNLALNLRRILDKLVNLILSVHKEQTLPK